MRLAQERPDLVAVGYFGSYARGDWSVGSDVDLVVVLASTTLPFERRAAELDATTLPVPADLLVYTQHEWQHITLQPAGRHLSQETVWVYGADLPQVRPDASSSSFSARNERLRPRGSET